MPDIPAVLRYSADHLWVRPDPGTSLVRAGVTDREWKGWCGDNPLFHTPVFILTHHPRPPLEMEGGTTFHFTDASPAGALQQARQAAAGLDVRIGGGPATIRAFLAADLIDYLHIVVVPIVLGRGVRLWDGLDALEARFRIEGRDQPQRCHPSDLHPLVTASSHRYPRQMLSTSERCARHCSKTPSIPLRMF